MPRVAKKQEVQTENTSPKAGKDEYIFAVGRDRQAVARVRLYPKVSDVVLWSDQQVKKGEIYVNQRPIEDYFTGDVAKAAYLEPLRITNALNRYAVTVKVAGGGPKGQIDAVIHGISRALAHVDEKHRSILKKKGYLTRDARARERRKVGTGGKARRKKQSPKR